MLKFFSNINAPSVHMLNGYVMIIANKAFFPSDIGFLPLPLLANLDRFAGSFLGRCVLF